MAKAAFDALLAMQTAPKEKPEADTSDTVRRKLDGVYQRTLWYVPRLGPNFLLNQPEYDDVSVESYREDDGPEKFQRKQVQKLADATALSSLAAALIPGDEGKEAVHLPVFDVDFPVSFDNQVLYFETHVSDSEAAQVMAAFKEAGLISAPATLDWNAGEFGVGPFRSRVLCRPSSTSGHFHVYIDAPVIWGAYKGLLKALSGVGLVEEGYAHASTRREQTFVRIHKNKRDCELAAESAKETRQQAKKSTTIEWNPF